MRPMKFAVEGPEQVQAAEQQLRQAGKLNGKGGTDNVLPAIVSALELYQGKLVQLRPIFSDLLWDGLTMLCSASKGGKSWRSTVCRVHR